MSTNLGPVIKDEEVAQRCIDAFCATYGYQSEVAAADERRGPRDAGEVEMIPNPQTPLQFAKARVEAYVLEIVRAHEIQAARDKAAEEHAAIEAL